MAREVQTNLPTVSERTLSQFYDVGTGDQNEYVQTLEQFRNALIQNNPYLCDHIDAEVSKFPPEMQGLIFGSILSTLLLLSRQSQIDKLQINIR